MRAQMIGVPMATLILAAVPGPVQAAEIIEDSPLRQVIVEHIVSHPEASLAEIAAFANASLLRHGLDFDFIIFKDTPIRQLVLEAGARRFVATRSELVDVGPCGENWFTIPALRADRQSIDIVVGGETITVRRPADLYLDPMRILTPDQKTVIRELEIPRVTYPDGVAADGSAVLFYFGLGEEAASWWRNVRTAQPLIAPDSNPFLILQVASEGVRFSEDVAQYEKFPEPYEDIKDFPGKADQPYVQRMRFPRSGFVLEYYAPCT